MCTELSPLERAVQFHGHICPGLLMGLRAAQFAQEYLGVTRDQDEELLAIVEHDSCGVDAIQAILGCTFGKGNLVFRDYGKQVYTVASREQNRAVRMVLKFGARRGPEYDRHRALMQKESLDENEEMEKENLRQKLLDDIITRPFETLFDYREIEAELPQRASIHATVRCEVCGEGVMEPRAVKTERGITCPTCRDDT